MSRPRLLLVCPTTWEQAALNTPDIQNRFEILICALELADELSIWTALRFRVFSYLDTLVARYRDAGLVGVIGCGDYPGCMFAAYIAECLGLPGAPLKAVVVLSHKLESRRVQARLVPEATPAFDSIDPWKKEEPKLPYPFFVKPIKGTMSLMAQLVEKPERFRKAISWSWKEWMMVWTVLWPYAQLLKTYNIPRRSIWGFIAEAPLCGVQVTVDGYVQRGAVTIMGVVDSVMFPGTMSFQRFEYPSTLPDGVIHRMEAIAKRFMEGSGLDNTCFNIEMFYDAEKDHIAIIELNPRMSYQFSDLYAAVDGISSIEVQIALAIGQPISWRPRTGKYGASASFVGRRFVDGRVTRVPSAAEIASVVEAFPSTHIEILCKPGDILSELPQDMGSFRYSITNFASQNRETLFAEYAQIAKMLPFEFV